MLLLFFFFNDTATTEIYTLSLHDALPISPGRRGARAGRRRDAPFERARARKDALTRSERAGYTARAMTLTDRKSTRLNSSHSQISYAVFCLKKKKTLHHH